MARVTTLGVVENQKVALAITKTNSSFRSVLFTPEHIHEDNIHFSLLTINSHTK